MDEERTREIRDEEPENRDVEESGDRVDPKALNKDQEAYRAQEWSPEGLEKREAAPEGQEKEYEWHQGQRPRPEGSSDAIEFIDVHKAFGRNKILNGLNLGLPDNQISMILGPSGTGKSVCIKHMVGLLYPDEGDVLVHGDSVPNMRDDDLCEMRKKFGSLFKAGAFFGPMNVYDTGASPSRQPTEKWEDEIGEICNRRLREVG